MLKIWAILCVVLLASVFAVPALGQNDVVNSLIHALKDNDTKVRENAAVALGEIKDARAVEPLVRALKDNNSEVRLGASSALRTIYESTNQETGKGKEMFKLSPVYV